MDGNNQIFPLAYGVGKSEDGDSWIWFLSKLKECIGEHPELVFISDRANSIALALRTVFPHASHGLCCRHLMVNLNLPKTKTDEYESLWWKTCKSYRLSDFEESFNALCAAIPRIRHTLVSIGLSKWSRAHFPGRRYQYMTSNSAESMNALFKHPRKVPITHLIESFRQSVQGWFYERRLQAMRNKHLLTPYAVKKIHKKIEGSRTWTVSGVGVSSFHVDDGKKNGFVDIINGTCSCRVWQVSGFPCGHVIAVSRFLGETDCSHYTSFWFHNQLYLKTYEGVINPLPHRSEWNTPDGLIDLQPPNITKRQAGRPRENKRILSTGEEPTQLYCSRCKSNGHHRDRCTQPMSSQRKSKSNSKKTGVEQTHLPTIVESEDYQEYGFQDTYPAYNLGDF